MDGKADRRRKTTGRVRGISWAQAVDVPTRCVAAIADAVMQPVGPALPELELVWDHGPAAPVLGERNHITKSRRRFADLLLQLRAIPDHARLPAGPGADLAAVGTGAEVALGLLARKPGDVARDADLPLEHVPVEEQRRAGIVDQLLALAACLLYTSDA